MYLRRTPAGRWRAEYRDAAGGRHGRTFDRKADGARWAADGEARVRRGRHADPRASRQPLGELAERWWAARVVEATTQATDRGRLDKHVLPEWGRWPVESITTSAVQGWVRRLSRDELGAWSVRSCYNILSSIMETARLDGLIPDNPCRSVGLPAKPPGREVWLSQDEVDGIAAAMDRRPGAAEFDRAVLYGLAYTGLRWGELAGLTRRRIDPMMRHLDVVETLIEVRGVFSVKDYPKGRRRRRVPIPPDLAEIWSEHLRQHPAGRDDMIFRPVTLGYRWGRSPALSRHRWPRVAFKPAVAAALGRDDVHPHDLRHSYASWLAEGGRPVTEIAALIGDTVQTAQRYLHATGAHEAAVAVLSRRGAL